MRQIVESKIENTIMEIYDDKAYFITPIEGFLLHHNSYDLHDLDTDVITYGFSTATVSIPIDYNFEENQNNIFVILESEVGNYRYDGSPSEEATEQDYKNALVEMGVVLND